MTERSPFADWPYLNQPKGARPEGPREANENVMASNNSLENFLGGSPLQVFIKLLFISLVVGALLMWLELRPLDLLRGVQHFFDRIYALGFGAVRVVLEYIAAGAVIVVPIWFVLRLFGAGGKR
ncbi:MAG: hypothetical protein C3F11_15955 [Methylocystaceae bacterium]|nr:MAG: hypothetical protein C3F11_15955 [Methylocystaceae bacterium]